MKNKILFYLFLTLSLIGCQTQQEVDNQNQPIWSVQENPGTLFSHTNYDYAPTIIEEYGVQHFWWCGAGTNTAGNPSDVIYYRSYTFSTATWTPIVRVLRPTHGTWDQQHVCDPSVVKGIFINPENSTAYLYMMYYTATDLGGTKNYIGLAYSNDRINWVKLSYPIISPEIETYDMYGAGQASAIHRIDLGEIWLFHTDTTTTPGRVWLRTSTDGVNFGPRTYFTINTARFHATSDIGYDPETNYFYAAVPGQSSTPAGSRPGEESSIGLYRIHESNLFNSSENWTLLGVVDSSLTGYDLNHNPGLLRNQFGYVSQWTPNLEVYFGAGGDTPSTWNLSWAILYSTPISVPLTRHYKNSNTDTLVTTGYIPSGYNFQETLGYLYQNPQPNTSPIYGCNNTGASGGDYMVTRQASCEGTYFLGVLGWGYFTKPTGISTRAIYRCYASPVVDHFLSRNSNCEGYVTEFNGNPYFYALTSQL